MKDVESASVDEYVVCEYAGEISAVCYVGVIRTEAKNDEDIEVEFLLKSDTVSGQFVKLTIQGVVYV